MQKKTPYDMLPNALKPEQIKQWNKYYDDYAKYASCCTKPQASDAAKQAIAALSAQTPATVATAAPPAAAAPPATKLDAAAKVAQTTGIQKK
mmetsp:Transcript_11396/g.13486  ORF Transcript_11396/g.13486 Transcript_11396/m.13486 type:complete len:92 (+) Transcript_11396:957-1232(+)